VAETGGSLRHSILVGVVPDLSSPDLSNSIGVGVNRRAQEVDVDLRVSDTALLVTTLLDGRATDITSDGSSHSR